MPSKQQLFNSVFEVEKNPTRAVEAKTYANREQHKWPWLAHELYDHLLVDAYSEASDVYAIGYLFKALYEFWKKGQELWMGSITKDTAIMDKIPYKVRFWMILRDCEERKSMLQVVDFFAQRPLVELFVSFYPI